MFVFESQTVKLPSGSIEIVDCLLMIGDSVLIFFEKYLIFDLIVFGLGKFEAGDTEIMLQTCDLTLVAVDLSDIKVNIMASWGLLMKLTVSLKDSRGCVCLF